MRVVGVGAYVLLAVTSSAALDVRWTPGPDEDARGNSFSSRQRFRHTKPGERLPNYYYADDASQGSGVQALVAAAVLVLMVGAMYIAKRQPPGPQEAVPDAEQMRLARMARFANEHKGR
ncbi:hypothetical protein KFE25_003411 [Diacronema lutheri]|uniref:Uncharacterized protein n=2 Tax=Diacronema lutheri TaxID=2081491 RepID=A0A8J6CEA1_DIALT|nr:hypothetical protein KFE25_003411 [Diacronema lutheri]